MDCRHDKMSIQEYSKKIYGFKTPYELVYFLIAYRKSNIVIGPTVFAVIMETKKSAKFV